MSHNIFAGGFIESDYVMDQLYEQEQTKVSETVPTTLRQEARPPIPSHYVDKEMHSFIVVGENRNQQVNMFSMHTFSRAYVIAISTFYLMSIVKQSLVKEFSSTGRRTPLVGNPISADELRKRVDALDNSVYSPIIVNGKLYFINLDNDTRTARSSTDVDDNIRTEILMKS
ncbi:hypothetical protein Y032_0033g2748 [Ancylostoma ceylanicum]|uniref:Uncharacterized protein n=1 Tax=Ancylostoma ceylanicum TaxID=53326 RepID=A0A016UMK8_9BILA|nr:hypothetical protein Y032_0033g2748 [Ancylostoma ceylanicum]